MKISILTFEGFNELDSLIAYGMLSRISLLGDTKWEVKICSPTPRVTSMNGLNLAAHELLPQSATSDAVLIGSGMKTREVAASQEIMGQITLNPLRQLIVSQCSGTFLMAKLGLLKQMPACTDLTSKPWVQAAGANIVNQPFFASGNLATAGGCLSAQYVSAWLVARLRGLEAAREVLHYFAPVGEKEIYVQRALSHIEPSLPTRVMQP
jgi:transcriptional regulator GlxA family with amidase domain